MPTPHLIIRHGNPDLLDLAWDRSITEWDSARLLDLPTGIHRHEIVFVGYAEGIYAIKELPRRAARREYQVLRGLVDRDVQVVLPAGLVERPWVDPHEESSAAVITRYLDFSFSYRELVSGGDFGPRRNQMLDGFAALLVELHLAGCYWGDCSLSNVLYRYDAGAIEVSMVDAETAELHDELSEGQREADLAIMTLNVAGGMADVAAESGSELDHADLALGEDIAGRYQALWHELTDDVVIAADERYRIEERIGRLNALGFEASDVELIPDGKNSSVRLRVKVRGRNFHTDRLRELTQIEAAESQARQILSDLYYFQSSHAAGAASPSDPVTAIEWRVSVFEPTLARIRTVLEPGRDPVQAYCDFLYHRFAASQASGRDIANDVAFADWLDHGRPGYPQDLTDSAS